MSVYIPTVSIKYQDEYHGLRIPLYLVQQIKHNNTTQHVVCMFTFKLTGSRYYSRSKAPEYYHNPMLHTQPSESTHDLTFLSVEVEELQHELKEVNHMNTLNRSVIAMLSETKFVDNKLFYSVASSLVEQVDMQTKRIRRVVQERNQMQGKIHILEKIVQHDEGSERRDEALVQEEIEAMKKEIYCKNEKLREYEEKIGEVDYLIGFTTKTVTIVDPSEQILKVQEEVTRLNELIVYQQEVSSKLFKQNEGLIKINMVLMSQLEKKKEQIQKLRESSDFLNDNANEEPSIHSQRLNVTHGSFMQSERSIIQRPDTSFAFLRFQKTLMEEDTDSDFDPENLCPELAVMFPQKVERIQKRREAMIPGLNMERVRVIMKKNRKKIDQDLRTTLQHVNPTQKIIDLETELEGARREVSKHILSEKELIDLRHKHETRIIELQQRNQLLLESNLRFQSNWAKLYKQFSMYQQVYKLCEQALGCCLQGQGLSPEESLKNSLDSLAKTSLPRASQVSRIIDFVRRINQKEDLPRHANLPHEI